MPLTAKLDTAYCLLLFWLSSEFFSSNYFQTGQHVVLLHIQIVWFAWVEFFKYELLAFAYRLLTIDIPPRVPFSINKCMSTSFRCSSSCTSVFCNRASQDSPGDV